MVLSPDNEMFEYGCHEGNDALANSLRGATRARGRTLCRTLYCAPIVTLVTARPLRADMLIFDGASPLPAGRSAVMRNCLV